MANMKSNADNKAIGTIKILIMYLCGSDIKSIFRRDIKGTL